MHGGARGEGQSSCSNGWTEAEVRGEEGIRKDTILRRGGGKQRCQKSDEANKHLRRGVMPVKGSDVARVRGQRGEVEGGWGRLLVDYVRLT